MLIDTHAHLADDKLFAEVKSVIKDAKKENVAKTVAIGCGVYEAEKSLLLAKKYNEIYATAGLYPHDNEHRKYKSLSLKKRLQEISRLLENEEVVAIGECGLDYTTPPPYEVERSKDEQKKLFIEQIKLSQSVNKPIIIHSRDATNDTLEILKRYYNGNNRHAGVWHCFTEDEVILSHVIRLGFYISINGIVTYNSADQVKSIAKSVDINRLLLETDAPYLVPLEPRKQGVKINSPQYVKIIAQSIARLRDVDYYELVNQTTKNACNLFKIKL